MDCKFVHLECFSEYSLQSGILRIDELVKRAASDGMQAIALTDHNNLFAAVKFYRAAISQGIKPIIGVSVLLEGKPIILLCQNETGYHNLSQLITKSYLERQDSSKPNILGQWLEDYNSGLIMLAKYAEDDLAHWKKVFSDRLYLSVWRIKAFDENIHFNKTLQLAKDLDCPIVALNNVCFLNKEDYEAHEARVCIHDGVVLHDRTKKNKFTEQQFLRTQEQMQALFADLPGALTNTVEIAKRCNFELNLGNTFLPKFPVPENKTPEQFLLVKAQNGLKQRFAEFKDDKTKDRYEARLAIELDVINKMGFASYFLIVADFIGWARENGVPVGPGRGSGAGSLVAYCLKITDLDPLQYDLLFERFLNPERVSMPDFDIDFCMIGRDRVIEYVANTYGRDSVSQIITYGTMAARAVIRDVGRVLGHPYGFVDSIATLIPNELGITLDKAIEQEEALKDKYKHDDEFKILFDLARKLEGITRNVGKHAGGVVIAPEPLVNFTPLYCEAGEIQTITQFDKDDVEAIGLVKFDFLGLRTLTIIDWAVKSINDPNLDISKIPLNDPKTFKLLCATNTSAVFQLESRGMKDLIRRLHPDCFEDIVALVALFRPGPLQSGMVDDFINRKLGNAAIDYPHPKLEPILKPTYGIILYQEQVMQIAQVLAGYSLGAADLLRRAMGKKKPEEMAKQREYFVSGAVGNGVKEELATYIFDLMEKFAGYGFNKSHSAAYAVLSYQTAWLKAHYPAQFMASVLSADMSHTDKIVFMIEDCKLQNIKVAAPDVNSGDYKFIVRNDNEIIYGLGAIKGIGEGAIENIINARTSGGAFKNLYDLCARTDTRKVTRRVIESLINCGALDCFGQHRAALMGNLARCLQASEQAQSNNQLGQDDLFADIAVDMQQDILLDASCFPEWSESVLLDAEKSSLGFYLSGHPINQYESELDEIITAKIIDLQPGPRNSSQTVAGLISAVRNQQTKRGDRMAFVSLEDKTGKIELAVFSDVFIKSRDLLKKDNIIVVQGECRRDDYSGGLRIRANKIFSLSQARSEFAKKLHLTIDARENMPDNFVSQLQSVLSKYRGGPCRVEINYKRKEANALISLGDDWSVEIQEDLLQELEDIANNCQAQICYHS